MQGLAENQNVGMTYPKGIKANEILNTTYKKNVFISKKM